MPPFAQDRAASISKSTGQIEETGTSSLYRGVDVMRGLGELAQLDNSKEWHVEVNNMPRLLSGFLSKKSTPRIQKVCDDLNISFEEVKDEKKKVEATQTVEKNLMDVVRNLKRTADPPRIVQICQAHNLRPKRRREAQNGPLRSTADRYRRPVNPTPARETRPPNSVIINTCNPAVNSVKPAPLFRRATQQMQVRTMQYNKRK